ncbi:hypothetical protein P153DRAFT_368648 [Dothidotthia symphoricarpi CBS 119687]|uniref:DUF521-domain-containing protein n=1 Tax=Dothidotthia symphoricarpi CBS 119687 TaxID=1392245 RepID=A0A6A6A9J7_9PLEO|nr:uncharacterized protein P153DRAFT_368648 [Dothidotthia symphoricarpi CBS 119687]KAF2127341.1 hypothetical protein P153DRAFT_368648 [Dothidotthia symphoricarpi CBS 119687]
MRKSSTQTESVFQGTAYVHGRASGKLIASDLALSFWGGIDPQTGEVIDRHHPLSGQYLQDTVLAIPGGRGSCSGSGVMLELLLNNKGPKAILFARKEDILTLGVMIAEEIFGKSIPVVTLNARDFQDIQNASYVRVDGNRVSQIESNATAETPQPGCTDTQQEPPTGDIMLTELDKAFLHGLLGEAARTAMRIILRMAHLAGAQQLMDVTQVHIDGCVYTGPGSLAFAEKLRDLGGRVLVPTTLNSISVDQRRWRALGIDSAFGKASERLATAYTDMGAHPTFTCAPYLLDSAPKRGDQVAWAESNAVVYANSVLGARTMKYPDFLDICIALTGRAPLEGMHIETNRLASLCVKLPDIQDVKNVDDSFYPLLGYCIGGISGGHIPVVVGLDTLAPSTDDLKAFGAAFATVASAPMFHIVGVTPEATTLEAAIGQGREVNTVDLDLKELDSCWKKFNTAQTHQAVDLVSLGNPHFSLTEVKKLASICRGRTKNKQVAVVVTCGRTTYGLANQQGLIVELEEFGVQFLTDTCWCMIVEPVIPPAAKVIMTNSAKYAHYGPGLTGRQFCFGSLTSCVETACQGRYVQGSVVS